MLMPYLDVASFTLATPSSDFPMADLLALHFITRRKGPRRSTARFIWCPLGAVDVIETSENRSGDLSQWERGRVGGCVTKVGSYGSCIASIYEAIPPKAIRR